MNHAVTRWKHATRSSRGDWLSHAQVSAYLRRSAEHEFVRRGTQAAEWLIQRATGSVRVVAVTHGGFRRILDARLRAQGWTHIPGARTYQNWSTWSYSRMRP